MTRIGLRHQQSHHHATEIDMVMMERAIQQARLAWEADEVPVGAVLYRGDQIIAEGHNLRESNTDPTAHAEILVIQEAARKLGEWRLNDCSLAVTLEPCPMCAGAIVNGRVGRLIYGATDPKAGAVDTMYELCTDRRLNHHVEVLRGVLAPQCKGVLRDFFKERRRINKMAREGADSRRSA